MYVHVCALMMVRTRTQLQFSTCVDVDCLRLMQRWNMYVTGSKDAYSVVVVLPVYANTPTCPLGTTRSRTCVRDLFVGISKRHAKATMCDSTLCRCLPTNCTSTTTPYAIRTVHLVHLSCTCIRHIHGHIFKCPCPQSCQRAPNCHAVGGPFFSSTVNDAPVY